MATPLNPWSRNVRQVQPQTEGPACFGCLVVSHVICITGMLPCCLFGAARSLCFVLVVPGTFSKSWQKGSRTPSGAALTNKSQSGITGASIGYRPSAWPRHSLQVHRPPKPPNHGKEPGKSKMRSIQMPCCLCATTRPHGELIFQRGEVNWVNVHTTSATGQRPIGTATNNKLRDPTEFSVCDPQSGPLPGWCVHKDKAVLKAMPSRRDVFELAFSIFIRRLCYNFDDKAIWPDMTVPGERPCMRLNLRRTAPFFKTLFGFEILKKSFFYISFILYIK